MELLLFVAKYGVITAAFLVVASSATKELSLLFARIRKQSKFVQLCVFAFIMTAVVYGGSKPSTNSVSTSTEPLNSFNSNVSSTHSATTNIPTLPQWYIEHGYPSTDTDGDGIPDAWERWTHTKPASNDALVDYDGDGVDNITEFMYMCDPIRKDTDGDGLDDRMEIDGLVASIEGLNPVVRATFDIPEPDLDGDGITDLWDDSGYYLFSDANNDGFDDVYANNMPAASQYNFDVTVTITTTRTALLSSEFGNILIAPCTNKVIKLRLSDSEEEGSVSLSAVPDDASLSGLWKARMDIVFLPRMGQATEKNRIKLYNGFYVDFENMTTDYVGIISSIQQRRNSNVNRVDTISIYYKPQYAKIITNTEDVCLEHGPAPQIKILAKTESLPLLIKVNGSNTFYMYENELYLSDYLNSTELLQTNIVIEIIDSHIYQIVNVNQVEEIALSKICRPSETNLVGASWFSTHNPNDASDHEPKIIIDEVLEFGPNCPYATNVTVKLGFSHDPNKVNTRNLPIIMTEDYRDYDTDHCKGLSFNEAKNINYDEFLDTSIIQFKDEVIYNITYDIYSDSVSSLRPPKSLFPAIYYLELRLKRNNATLDTMWLVVYSQEDSRLFNDWCIEEQCRGQLWLQNLPKPYESLNFIKSDGIYGNIEFNDGKWKKTSVIDQNSYMHHNASYESRSYPVDGGHGHQATYDSNGELIKNGIAAGSADFSCPNDILSTTIHRKLDVVPFIQAVQIDGNPCYPKFYVYIIDDIPTHFTRPCLYQGTNLNTYFNYRPATPTGIIQNEGGNP